MKFLNHDIITEVARLVGVFGKDSSSLALVSQESYQALISLFEEWVEYRRGFGLPRSLWISESSRDDTTFNYRAAVVDSLKWAAEADRSRVLMEPERYVDISANETAFPADQSRIVLARTGHLRSEKFSALWGSLMELVARKAQVGFLSVLPVASPSSSGAGIYSIDIGDSFLRNCSSLTSVDLAGLSSVTTIGNWFLRRCSSLMSVDLAGLSSVTAIGDWFLHDCSSLISLNLASLSSVTSIDSCFLYGCNSMTSLDLAGLSSVASIGNGFLYGCSSLTSVDLAGLSSVTSIGSHFLYDCSSLTSVDLAGLSSVTTIDNYFLHGCSSLTSVDLAGLSSMTASVRGRLSEKLFPSIEKASK